MTENLKHCPLCGNAGFTDYLELQDHFLSKESFFIRQCGACGFRFVNPRPGKEEIGKYYQSDEYISHDAEKRDLLSRIYRIARVFSIRGKYRIVSRYAGGGKLLDIGCGTGEFLKYCRTKGFEVAGVEPNEKARTFAIANNGLPVSEMIDDSAGLHGTFRCITLWHVLEHVHDLDETLDRIGKLLAPDGVLVVAVPNSNSWDARKYKGCWAAYDVPRHLYHFTRETMHALAGRKGFRVIKTIPQKLDAYYVSMLSEKYLRGKTSLPRFVFNGFWSNLMAGKERSGHSSLIFVLSAEKS